MPERGGQVSAELLQQPGGACNGALYSAARGGVWEVRQNRQTFDLQGMMSPPFDRCFKGCFSSENQRLPARQPRPARGAGGSDGALETRVETRVETHLDLEDASGQLEDGDVERPAPEVIHRHHRPIVRLTQAVRHCHPEATASERGRARQNKPPAENAGEEKALIQNKKAACLFLAVLTARARGGAGQSAGVLSTHAQPQSAR